MFLHVLVKILLCICVEEGFLRCLRLALLYFLGGSSEWLWVLHLAQHALDIVLGEGVFANGNLLFIHLGVLVDVDLFIWLILCFLVLLLSLLHLLLLLYLALCLAAVHAFLLCSSLLELYHRLLKNKLVTSRGKLASDRRNLLALQNIDLGSVFVLH